MTPFEDDGLCQNLRNIKAAAEDPFPALISLSGKEGGFHMAAQILISDNSKVADSGITSILQGWKHPKGAPGASQGHRGVTNLPEPL